MVKQLFTSSQWTSNFSSTSTELPHQGVLEQALESIFQEYTPLKNARKKVAIKNPQTGGYLEVDVWYPEINICFEYQDDYHYQPSWYSHIPLGNVQEKDNIKKDLLLQRGETLILVPCWWDGTTSSLQATIDFQRPDLLLKEETLNDIIPMNPARNFFPESSKLMLASFPRSAEMVNITENNPWWLGEKYDGVRCFWSPKEKQLYSRHMLKLGLHPSVTQHFGSITLDGEIWCGINFFLEAQIAITSTLDRVYWPQLRVICFDEASTGTHDLPFENRYSLLLSHCSFDNPVIIIAARFLCTNNIILANSLKLIVEEGGEGIILRKPFSRYLPGRSTSLLKIKASRADQEALVVDVGEDGSLLLQLPNGATFVVPKTDCVLAMRAKRGDIVTFTHDFVRRGTQDSHASRNTHAHAWTQDFARGLPSNPVVYRIRTDLSWEDVTGSSFRSVRQFLNDPYQQIDINAHQPKGYWNYDKGKKNMRALLESLARRDGFDPLIAENWYPVTAQEFLLQHKEVKYVLSNFGNSLIKALINLFPELNFNVAKFSSAPRMFWDNAQNRRALLENFARSKGSDPLLPHFWYNLNPAELRAEKGMAAFSQYYQGYVETVVHLFPELHLDSNKFKANKGKDDEESREFFERFAASKGLDPRNPNSWSLVSISDLKRFDHGYKKIIQHYGGKLSDCLMHLYPDIGLKQSHFDHLLNWNSKAKRKAVLLNFAKIRSFDPFVPENWYQLSWTDFSYNYLVRSMITQCYKKRYVAALMDLLPELNFKPYKFVNIPVGYWEEMKNRRELFTEIARRQGFDPLIPSHWYTITYPSIANIRGVRSILDNYYKGSLINGLMDIFPDIGFQRQEFMVERERRKDK